jgi:ribosomal protein L9
VRKIKILTLLFGYVSNHFFVKAILSLLREQIFNSLSLSFSSSKIQVAKQKSVDLDTKSIMLDKPIDSLGEFDVPLWIDGRELEEKLKVVVKKKAYK